MLRKIVSGGQTGVDRAALDAALEAGVACGGWCPRGRRAEDGPLDARYPLEETPGRDYAQRTTWNVGDADATLILARLPLRGGSALTQRSADRIGRPVLVVDPEDPGCVDTVRAWLERSRIGILNVAGPRESQQPGAYAAARRLLDALLRWPRGEAAR